MTTTTTIRIVANRDLAAGDRIATPDGWVTLEGDAISSSRAPGMVCVDVAAGTLYLAAAQSSRVLADHDGGGDVIDEDYLMSKGYPSGLIELFSLGIALGRGRERGVSDEATIHRFCLADVDDRDRLMEFGQYTDETQLQPTAQTALTFLQSYGDVPL